MTTPPPAASLIARNGDVSLAGSLWLPAAAPVAMLVMHPGSGPTDRHNGAFFPPIRAALLNAGIAVASYDKRGVGDSGGSWLEAGVEEQAGDLLAGLAAATEMVPGVPRGAFGHSEGGWVALEATRAARTRELAFAVTSAGPAIRVGESERIAGRRALQRSKLNASQRSHSAHALDTYLGLAEAGASHAEMLEFAHTHAAALAPILGDELPDERLWRLFVRLAAFDPLPALRALRVPLLAAFGAEDNLTPTARSVEVLRESVDPALLQVAVLAGAGHRMSLPDSTNLVDGYPDVIVDFVLTRSAAQLRL